MEWLERPRDLLRVHQVSTCLYEKWQSRPYLIHLLQNSFDRLLERKWSLSTAPTLGYLKFLILSLEMMEPLLRAIPDHPIRACKTSLTVSSFLPPRTSAWSLDGVPPNCLTSEQRSHLRFINQFIRDSYGWSLHLFWGRSDVSIRSPYINLKTRVELHLVL